MTERTQGNTIMASLLAGMLGAGVALLLAPKSGKETRESLQQTAGDVRSSLEEKLEQAQKSLEQSIIQAQKVTDQLFETMHRKTKNQENPFINHIETTDPRRKIAPRSSIISRWEEEV